MMLSLQLSHPNIKMKAILTRPTNQPEEFFKLKKKNGFGNLIIKQKSPVIFLFWQIYLFIYLGQNIEFSVIILILDLLHGFGENIPFHFTSLVEKRNQGMQN